MEIKIDKINNYGKTYVRNREKGIYVEVEISVLNEAGLEQGETYPLSKFPEQIQNKLKKELAYAESIKNKALKEAEELKALKARAKFSYVEGTANELFNKKYGKIKDLNPDVVLSFTSGRGFQCAFFKGYAQNKKGDLFHFEDAESLLKHMFGEKYSNRVIFSKTPGKIIGSGGKNIKALSAFVGFRLSVEQI